MSSNQIKIKPWLRKYQAKKAKYLKRVRKLEELESDSCSSLESVDSQDLNDCYIGTIIENRFMILKYLSSGTFSKVWIGYDFLEFKIVAIKMFNAGDEKDAQDELNIFEKLGKMENLVSCNYNFVYKNSRTNLNHMCLVMDLYGQNLLSYLDPYQNNLSIPQLKSLFKKMLVPVQEYFKKDFVHVDLKLENFLTNSFRKDIKMFIYWFSSLNLDQEYKKRLEENLTDDFHQYKPDKKKKIKRKIKSKILSEISNNITPQILDQSNYNNLDIDGTKAFDPVPVEDVKIFLSDFGTSCHINDIYENTINFRAYRPPENIINETFCQNSDLWSLGCLFYEIITDQVLFEVSDQEKGILRDRKHLYLMYQLFGKMPQYITNKCESSYDLFDDNGNIIGMKKVVKFPLNDLIKRFRQDLEDDQIQDLTNFLTQMLKYNPKERVKPDQLLKNEWLNSKEEN